VDTEKVILRLSIDGRLLNKYNNVKHAAISINGHETKIYEVIETRMLYKDSYWQYAFVKKEIELLESESKKEQMIRQETFCLKCGNKFLTRNKRINHVCSNCNIINDNLWENNTIYKIHMSV